MHRWLILGITLIGGGCDRVFGLDRPIDAPLPPVDASGIDTPTDCLPTEHDEDLDGTPDRCDACPMVPGDNTDSDGDGIGDVCDPDADRINHVLAFYAFDVIPSSLALVTEGGGTWSVSNDRMVLSGGTVPGDYFARFDANTAGVQIETVVTLSFTGAPAGSRSAGLWAEAGTSTVHPAYPPGAIYEIVDYNLQQYGQIYDNGTGHIVNTSPSPRQFQNGVRYLLRYRCDPNVPSCNGQATTLDDGMSFGVLLEPTTIRAGGVGLRAHGDVTASFDYLAVYDVAPQ